jgi:hypothetical protein
VAPPPAPTLWIDAAVPEIVNWARGQANPLVVSFAQPWTSHDAVRRAKQAIPGLRWAAHFSDPWTDSPYAVRNDGAKFSAEQQLEREIISLADVVVFVTEDAADLVMRKYPAAWRSKVHVIPHLIDPDIPQMLPAPRRDPGVLRLVHAGSLYEGKRAPDGLFAALRNLAACDPGAAPPLHFRFVGWVPEEKLRLERDDHLGKIISWTTPLYYTPSLKEMAGADVLVVIDADFECSPFLPSKLFDYLIFDKPIIGLTPQGSTTAGFLDRIGYPSVRPNDEEAIKSLFRSLLQQWRSGQLKPTPAHLAARRAHDLHVAGAQYLKLLEELRS